jgi:hypothetical protein
MCKCEVGLGVWRQWTKGRGLWVVSTCCGLYSRLNHRAMPSGLLYAGSEIYCGCVVRWFDRPLVARGVSGCGLFPICSGAYSFISPSFRVLRF